MPAARVKLAIDRGATFEFNARYDAGQPPAPVDLTGCTARMQVRQSVESPEVLLELSTENARITLGGPAGTITLAITATDTAAITWAGGVYDFELQFPGGRVKRLFYGTVTVSPDVTR
jgi:hypothetical protein